MSTIKASVLVCRDIKEARRVAVPNARPALNARAIKHALTGNVSTLAKAAIFAVQTQNVVSLATVPSVVAGRVTLEIHFRDATLYHVSS